MLYSPQDDGRIIIFAPEYYYDGKEEKETAFDKCQTDCSKIPRWVCCEALLSAGTSCGVIGIVGFVFYTTSFDIKEMGIA